MPMGIYIPTVKAANERLARITFDIGHSPPPLGLIHCRPFLNA